MTQDPQPEPVLIAGTGALACLLAALLARSGTPVHMLGSWPEGLEALRRHGVRIVQPDGQVTAYPVQASADPGEFRGTRHALVLVKAWQTEETARRLAVCLAPDGVALTLQNGLGNLEILAEVLGAERAAAGVITSGASLPSPGCVLPGGEGSVTLGQHPRLAPLAQTLRRAGAVVQMGSDLAPVQWGKLVINAAINPLTALIEAPNGFLIENPAARRLLASLALEAAAVASALGIALPYPDPVATVEEVARLTARNRSSMLQDLQRGAPTEIDVICGAVVRLGAKSGVPTPVNETVWRLVRAKAHRAATDPMQPAVDQTKNQSNLETL